MRRAQRTSQGFKNGSHNRKMKDHRKQLNQPQTEVPKVWEALAELA
ncbi:hypothetical protein Voja6_00217 [Pseudomonas phage vB_PpuM-Voja-6]